MNLASLVLRIRPQTRRAAETALAALPGVECHDMTADGRLIVTVEDVAGTALSEVLIAIAREPLVLAATLAYEYSGDESRQDHGSNEGDDDAERCAQSQLNNTIESASKETLQ